MVRMWTCTFLFASSLLAAQQSSDQRREWNEAVEPFRVIGNIYYVGAAGVSAFLIHTPDGFILLDGGLPETAPRIAQNVAKLGFDIRGVKQLLNSHAHFDHGGGLAELQRLSGAPLAASAADGAVLSAGSEDMPAVRIGRTLADGDTIVMGGTVMTAHITPGHTKGCTTWTTTAREAGRDYDVVFHCSTSVVDTLIGNQGYPGIVADYRRTFERIATLEADVFLGNHPSFFDMAAKRTKMAAGAPNPFVDSSELKRFNERSKAQFEAALQKEASGRRLPLYH